jgi:hypothetical protein
MSDRSGDHIIYEKAKPFAEPVKIVCQMLIGVVIVVKLFFASRQYFLCYSDTWNLGNYIGFQCAQNDAANPTSEMFVLKPILEIVGYGLAISAGIDLAWMLFTPKIDEAVDPLILALSSAAILVVSKELDNWPASLALIVMTASIVVLFWVRKTFLQDDEARPSPSETAYRPTTPGAAGPLGATKPKSPSVG